MKGINLYYVTWNTKGDFPPNNDVLFRYAFSEEELRDAVRYISEFYGLTDNQFCIFELNREKGKTTYNSILGEY